MVDVAKEWVDVGVAEVDVAKEVDDVGVAESTLKLNNWFRKKKIQESHTEALGIAV